MSYTGAGTFVINSSGQPVVSGTVISSTVFNALTADLGVGLSTAICKDGQTVTTARVPFLFGISSTLTTDSTSIGTGSIITSGGVGVTKALWVGGLANIAGAVTMQSTASATLITSTSAGFYLGGTTSSDVVLTKSSTQFQVKLGDGSAFTSVRATTYLSDSSIFYLGGTTSSEVSLRRSGTSLYVRLGDDSAYAGVLAADIVANGGVLYLAGTTSAHVSLRRSGTTVLIRKGDDSAAGDLTCGSITCGTITPSLLNYAFGGVTATRNPNTITSQTYVDGILMAES